MSFADLVPGEMVLISGEKKAMFVGPGGLENFVFVEKIGAGNYNWLILDDQACIHLAQSWEDEPLEGRLATEEDVGTVVYNEDGDACMLIGVNFGPFGQYVISYGGDTLSWSSECYIPKDQAKADAEYELNEQDEDEEETQVLLTPEELDTVSNCKQGACQGSSQAIEFTSRSIPFELAIKQLLKFALAGNKK